MCIRDSLSTDTTRWEIESQVENLASEISAGNTDAALQTFDRILHHVQEEQSDYLYSADVYKRQVSVRPTLANIR